MTIETKRPLAAKATSLAAGLLATTMLTAAAAPAFAQGAASSGGGAQLEELVVTAQKREENLQSVPASIQALSTQALDQRVVKGLEDYVKFLPSVSFKTAGPGFTSVYMRGVASGENGNHSGPRPSVGVYLDEMPVTTITGPVEPVIYDIARVEVLAGPQGTLYGASSQAGTIRIITNKPSTTGFAAGYDLDVNSVAPHGDLGYTAEGYVNQPLSDRAAIRLVGWYEHDGGYIDNVHTTRTYPVSGITLDNKARAENSYNDIDIVGARAALKLDLNENWTVTPGVMAQKAEQNGLNAYDPHLGDLNVGHFLPDTATDKWVMASLTVQGKIANLDATYAGAYMKRHVDTQSDYSDYSYFYDQAPYYYGNYITDAAGNLIDPSQFVVGHDRYTKESHEFRVASPASDRFRFVAGVFYEKQQHNIEQNYLVQGLDPALSPTGHPNTLWLTKQLRTDIDEAVFGEATYDVTSKLSVTGGIRFFRADNSLKGFFGFGSGFSSGTGEAKCFGPPVVSGAPCTNLNKTTKEDGHTYKVNATYHLTDDKMVYATYSTGYRPGGINRRGTVPPYQSDYLKNYEVGWKTTWADNSLRWNGAVFLEKWEKFQFSFLGANGLTEIRNAPQAEMKGLETEVNWVPAEGLTLSGGGAYTNAKLTKQYCADITQPNCSNPAAPNGTELPITPKWKGNVTARYEWNTAYDLKAHVQGALVYEGARWTDLRVLERGIIGRMPSYTTADFTAGVERSNWRLEAYIKNAFDERGQDSRYAECATQVCGPQTYVVPIKPRLIGIRFGQSF
ncbi:TonB-dependent receptor [Phenylobacterium soli]|uniref:TonB-dependent receptor n=1 Tax=Phenylobacterium soli TaxID=2170551 RepID=A0A328AFS6_9CAUL|nr:TonB-dependent receptor [Phenylobacterium soli]RAK53377.1 TonB-dependent receptor [Phenylobacterium soli]